jgi:hypothetical protein
MISGISNKKENNMVIIEMDKGVEKEIDITGTSSMYFAPND